MKKTFPGNLKSFQKEASRIKKQNKKVLQKQWDSIKNTMDKKKKPKTTLMPVKIEVD